MDEDQVITQPEDSPQEKPEEEKAESQEQDQQEQEGISPMKNWGDYRRNPLFLKVAGYFGIGEKDYSYASKKIASIVDWAYRESDSKKASDILLKISETSRKLQSPGYGERRYAILYRYIVLSGEKRPIEEKIKKLGETKEDIEKEMRAYEHGATS